VRELVLQLAVAWRAQRRAVAARGLTRGGWWRVLRVGHGVALADGGGRSRARWGPATRRRAVTSGRPAFAGIWTSFSRWASFSRLGLAFSGSDFFKKSCSRSSSMWAEIGKENRRFW
jgi:hypothetical protein